MAGLPGAFHAVEEGVHDLVVAAQGEDQRDVDADSLGQARGDRRQALPGGRDLDEQVGPVDQPPQRPRLGDRRRGVVREPGIDLDRDPSVHAARRVVDRAQHVARPADVGGGQRPQRLTDPDSAGGQVTHLLVVRVAAVMALAKIVGLVVTPTTRSRATRSARLPDTSRSRLRSSSQIETPALVSAASGLVIGAPSCFMAAKCRPG